MFVSQSSKDKLTQLSHGGGCGCKIAPALLKTLIVNTHDKLAMFPKLLVGNCTADDAAVYQINEHQAVVATTDFFMPIVDDPFDFGRIAATNALSDIYAMGGEPMMALAIVGMPIDKLSTDTIKAILAGGEAACQEAGIPIAGGHSIDSLEPIYGLAVFGLVHPQKIKRNSDAKAGDVLIISKPLGIGILAHAIKKGVLKPEDYQQLIHVTTQLNKVGKDLASLKGVHALTDITGFGLAGHLLELSQGAGLAAHIHFEQLPILLAAEFYAKQGIRPGAIERNYKSFGHNLDYAKSLQSWQQCLTLDPQTSGGLMVSVLPDVAQDVLALFRQSGFIKAAVVGELITGPTKLYFD